MKWGPEAELELRRWAEIDERGSKDSCMTAALEEIKRLDKRLEIAQGIVDKNSEGYQLLEALRDTQQARIKELEIQLATKADADSASMEELQAASEILDSESRRVLEANCARFCGENEQLIKATGMETFEKALLQIEALKAGSASDVMGKIYLQCYQALGECQEVGGVVQPPSPGPPLFVRVRKVVEALKLADALLIQGRPMGAFGTAIDEWEKHRARYVAERAPKVKA